MKKNILKIVFSFVVFASFKLTSQTQVTLEGKKYFVDVRTSNGKADIWFTEKSKSSSLGDKLIFTMVVMNTTFGDATKRFCNAKKVIDGGKTVLGCLSVVGAAGCAMATVATDGAAAVLCTSTWAYAESKGIKDCVLGISDIIAEQLKKDPQWITFKGAANLTDKNYEDVIDNTIDALCELNK